MTRIHTLISLFFLIMIALPQEGLTQICVGTQGEVTWSYWRNLGDDEFGELYAEEYYPNTPDGFRILNSVKSPENFDNYFGSLTKGFITVPTTESITFNITGDDDILFYLSSDESPDNLQLEAYIEGHTNREEHDKFPEQTTRTITLNSDSYYYFEVHHIEGGGGDHVALWWKTSFTGLVDWNYVSSQYIANIGCEESPCMPRGTSCDDGDSTTTDDQEDGHCNCIGIPATSNSCVGERGKLEAYYYDNIPGSNLDDLYEDPDFPAMPERYELLDMLGINLRYNVDSFGTLVQGFLTVPVTGFYEFNLTSNQDAIFFLSSNEDPALKQTHQILTTNSTGTTEHNKYVYQSTAPLMLSRGAYYFFEINHKESSWSEHYNIFWKTPFNGGDNWKRIPTIYIYDYNCEISCIPENTPCDDLNPFTNDDAFDANCTCVGVPCNGPDCDDPQASYVPYPECGLTDRLDNRADASWLSCQATLSPNPIHGNRHWLQYDLGIEHKLWSSHVWNYNVTGATNEGFESVAIDYSADGINWTNLGTYNWSLASGDSEYSGFMGPDFGGVRARYILVSSLDNISTCRGISKMTFSTQECGLENTSCDDGNLDTINDVYDADCNCNGIARTYNDCSQDTLMLGDTTLTLDKYSAISFINSQSHIQPGSTIDFEASESIVLSPGFESMDGAILTVQIGDCSQTQSIGNTAALKNLREQIEDKPLIVFPIEGTDEQWIGFFIRFPSKVKLDLVDSKGKLVTSLMDHHVDNPGYFTKRIRTKKLQNTHYEVRLTTDQAHYRKQLTVDNL